MFVLWVDKIKYASVLTVLFFHFWKHSAYYSYTYLLATTKCSFPPYNHVSVLVEGDNIALLCDCRRHQLQRRHHLCQTRMYHITWARRMSSVPLILTFLWYLARAALERWELLKLLQVYLHWFLSALDYNHFLQVTQFVASLCWLYTFLNLYICLSHPYGIICLPCFIFCLQYVVNLSQTSWHAYDILLSFMSTFFRIS